MPTNDHDIRRAVQQSGINLWVSLFQLPPAVYRIMSESLAKSIDRMKVAPVPRMNLAIPSIKTHGRVCFYGFAVTIEWLVNYAESHWDGAGQYGVLAKANKALWLLRSHSHIKNLEFESALVDSTTPPETRLNVVPRTVINFDSRITMGQL